MLVTVIKSWSETRRRKCECGVSMAMVFDLEIIRPITVPQSPDLTTITGLSVGGTGEARSVNFFGNRTKRQKRTIRRYETMFVFCDGCNRRHQIGMFKP